jgi:hypothetical protein
MVNLDGSKLKMDILPVRNPTKVNNHLRQYLGRWQQNNNPNDLGIVRFVFDLFEINRQMGFPPLIRDFKPEYSIAPWASDALSSWFTYEKGMTKDDWCHVVATFREGSKTTWYSHILPTYLCLVGQHGIYHNNILLPEFDYTVSRGKNNKEAQKRIMFINAFFNKPLIKLLFGELKPTFKEVKDKEGKDSGNLLILTNGYIFECSGIEQPSRGLNIMSVRPKLFIFDDVQNKENTKTLDRRNQIDEEVMMESFGAVADEGSMIYIANKVHRSDTLGRLLDDNNFVWKKHLYTLTVRKGEDGKLYPGVGDLDSEIPSWDKRWTIEKVKKRKKFYETQPKLGGLKGFLKEYYNIIKSDADYKIKYYVAEYKRIHGINWLIFTNPVDDVQTYKNIYITIGFDPAISEKKTACDSSITVLAVDSDHNRYLLEQRFGKWDIHDRYFDDKDKIVPLALLSDDLVKIKRLGSTEEFVRLTLKYYPDAMDIEAEVGQQWGFYNEVSQLLKDVHYPKIPIPEKSPSEGKEEKLKQVPLMHFESGIYYLPGEIDKENKLIVRKDFKPLESDIDSFPDCPKDRLDSIYLAEQVISFPRKIPFSPLGYMDVEQQKRNVPIKSNKSSLLNDYEGWVVD